MRKRIGAILIAVCLAALAQQPDVLYDEAKVPKYTLPEVLALRSGQPVRDAKTWTGRRRQEILAVYESEVYGKSPAKPSKLNYEVSRWTRPRSKARPSAKWSPSSSPKNPARPKWICSSTSPLPPKNRCR